LQKSNVLQKILLLLQKSNGVTVRVTKKVTSHCNNYSYCPVHFHPLLAFLMVNQNFTLVTAKAKANARKIML